MSDFRVNRDKFSGSLIIEKDFVAEDRIGLRIDMIFVPKTLWQKLLFLLGMNFPGPTALEVESNGKILFSDSRRKFVGIKVEEQTYLVAPKGPGVVRAMLNPEDFYHRWKVSMRIQELNN